MGRNHLRPDCELTGGLACQRRAAADSTPKYSSFERPLEDFVQRTKSSPFSRPAVELALFPCSVRRKQFSFKKVEVGMDQLIFEIKRKRLAVFAFTRSRIGIYRDGVFYGRFYSWRQLRDIRGGYDLGFRTLLPVDTLTLETAGKSVKISMAWYNLQPMATPLKKTASWKSRGDDAAYSEMLADYLGELKAKAFAGAYQ